MQNRPPRPNMAIALVAFLVLFGLLTAFARTLLSDDPAVWSVSGRQPSQPTLVEGAAESLNEGYPTRKPSGPLLSPTPDAPHPLPGIRKKTEQYTVQAGDSLGQIAKKYGVSLEQLSSANALANPDLLEVGQILTIPVPTPEGVGPDFKVIPDSELVYGPASVAFDTAGFINSQGGYLASYQEEVDGKPLSGTKIVERIAQDYSVNPRLLLAALQYQSEWITNPNPPKSTLKFPIGVRDQWRKGLYFQLAWAANNLNRGYYLWRVNGAATWLLSDGSVVPIAPTINAGTAGVQNFFAALADRQAWEKAVSADGLFATYNALFGYPFDYAVEPLLPAGLQQPQMQLPFEPGKKWAFTGGPHGGWADGSAWAGLDFAPPGEALGCVESNAWVTAVADGMILRAGDGAVIQDLDGDGLEQTNWVVLYMHIEKRDRVKPGTLLKAGERIGHPSCEGGVSNGTHVHLARRYNGEWIPADQDIPFVLDGWVSRGAGKEYDGFLVRGKKSIEAYAGRSPSNGIYR